MSARLSVALVAAVILCGCSSVETVKKDGDALGLREVNRAVRGKVVRLELRDGRAMHVVGLNVAADSLTWIDRRDNRLESLSTQSVHELSIQKTGRGAVRGFLFGAVVGAVAGAVRARMEGDDPISDPLAITREEKLRIYPVAHAVYAVLATTPIGAMIGTRKVYRFNNAGYPVVVSGR